MTDAPCVCVHRRRFGSSLRLVFPDPAVGPGPLVRLIDCPLLGCRRNFGFPLVAWQLSPTVLPFTEGLERIESKVNLMRTSDLNPPAAHLASTSPGTACWKTV